MCCLSLAVLTFPRRLLISIIFGFLMGLVGASRADTHYVNVANSGAVFPYTNWSTASSNIQAAIDAAVAGDDVLVTNGVYATGGSIAPSQSLTNRVTITKMLRLKSVNGPAVTVIRGARPSGNSAVRCLYADSGATVQGFTLTNGATQYADFDANGMGGGIYGVDAVVSNCVLSGNTATYSGGGAHDGTFYNCTFLNNVASGGAGASDAFVYNSTFWNNTASGSGGGVSGGYLSNCTVSGNSAPIGGGGVVVTLVNCILSSNTATEIGGGVDGGWVRNCTFSDNGAVEGAGAYGAAVYDSTFWNNIASSNGGGAAYGSLSNCTMAGNSALYGGGSYQSHMTNCTLTGNAAVYGGGARQGTLFNCALSNNVASYGGGASEANLLQCLVTSNAATLGGGARGGTLSGCVVSLNSATNGGGVYMGTVTSSALTGNTAATNGGAVYGGSLSNCIISGNAATSGGGAYLGKMTNCTFIGNVAVGGGGVCGSDLINCSLSSNTAFSYGGGSLNGILKNCALTLNSSLFMGGGAYRGVLNNCTVVGNVASESGGGVYAGTLYNSIVYYNKGNGPNWSESELENCCTTPSAPGSGNITNEPGLASLTHLKTNSICIGKGSVGYASGVDLDGESWLNPPAMGSDEIRVGAVTGMLNVAILAAYTNLATGFASDFTALITGRTTTSRWNFGDGSTSSNQPFVTHAWGAAGSYKVILTAYNESNPSGISATVTVAVITSPVCYVKPVNSSAMYPYTNWQTAATSIQSAVDAAAAGGLVLVTNGVYASGARVVNGNISNRVAITKPVTVRSVNGAAVTVIKGTQPRGESAVRCVYMAPGSTLSGFTVTNGATRTGGDTRLDQSGGGIWCVPGALVTNCVISGNSAWYAGSGVFRGRILNSTLLNNATAVTGGGACESELINCTLTGNSAGMGGGGESCQFSNCLISGNSAESGGAAYSGTLLACIVSSNRADAGGGTSYAVLSNCTLSANAATTSGGGSELSTLVNCALTRNSARNGGGAYGGALYNCTFTGNFADTGGGAESCELYNSILFYNTSVLMPGTNTYGCTLNYCCTSPLEAGEGNINDAPVLASASHLGSGSPCSGAGSVAYAGGVDFDGEPWSIPPSMGCDEVHVGALTGTLTVAISASYSNVAVGYPIDFTALITGATSLSRWNFGDGSVVSNLPFLSHAWAVAGNYSVVLTAFSESYPAGRSATVTVSVVTAPVCYVNCANPTPMSPYTDWTTAATSIQVAVDAVLPGGLVLVTNGVYDFGARAVYGSMSNRLVIGKSVAVCSVNGPDVTFILGSQYPAMRCAIVGSGCMLAGFTLTNGNTLTVGDEIYEQSGGGVLCAPGATVSNCNVTGCYAANIGGGLYGGTLFQCEVSGNSADKGAGAGGGASAYRCLFFNNSAELTGGGAYLCELYNCLIQSNSAIYWGGSGASDSSLYNCLVVQNNVYWGLGAVSGCVLYSCTLADNRGGSAPGAYRSSLYNSIACFNLAPRLQPADSVLCGMEYCCSTLLQAGPGNVSGDPRFVNLAAGDYRVTGRSPGYNAGTNQEWMTTATDLNGLARILDGVVDMGAFESRPETHYVNAANPTPLMPYTNWSSAANVIQDAIETAVEGDTVVVTNGLYTTGGAVAAGLTNRVAVTRAVTVLSVNGATATTILGQGPVGMTAVRCVYLTNDAILAGFTLSNGHTRASGDADREQSGGGVWSEESGVVSNCVMVGNTAFAYGGGIRGGTVFDSRLAGNTANAGGGADFSVMYRSVLTNNMAEAGGGADFSTLVNCILTCNKAAYSGGGSYGGTLYNCLLSGNSAEYSGGGANYGILNNCTLVSNSASYCGGADEVTLNNSIIYFNVADSKPNWTGGSLSNCCTTPRPLLSGSISTDPQFAGRAAGDYRLAPFSPCIDTGTNQNWMADAWDLEGRPRILNGRVDIGAYESIPAALDTDGDGLPDWWEWAYAHNLTNMNPQADEDGDGMKNGAEYLAGTVPTNILSCLRLTGIGLAGSGYAVQWESASNRFYAICRATNLMTGYLVMASNLPATPPANSYTDAVPPSVSGFYRLDVTTNSP